MKNGDKKRLDGSVTGVLELKPSLKREKLIAPMK
jgi:hypothetical protein